MKKKVGRPKKKNKKSDPFSIRLSENNYKIINQIADETKISKSEIIDKSLRYFLNSGYFKREFEEFFNKGEK
jgi:predicted transcriptional regulator